MILSGVELAPPADAHSSCSGRGGCGNGDGGSDGSGDVSGVKNAWRDL